MRAAGCRPYGGEGYISCGNHENRISIFMRAADCRPYGVVVDGRAISDRPYRCGKKAGGFWPPAPMGIQLNEFVAIE